MVAFEEVELAVSFVGSAHVEAGELVGGLRLAEGGCFFEVLDSFCFGGIGAFTLLIEDAEEEMGLGVITLSGLDEMFDGFWKVLKGVGVVEGELVVGFGVVFFDELVEPGEAIWGSRMASGPLSRRRPAERMALGFPCSALVS